MSLVARQHAGSFFETCRSVLALRTGKPSISFVVHAIIGVQLAILAAVWFQSAVPLERLFRDTIAVAEDYPGCCHVYDGLVSNLGILLWWTTASITGFVALVVASISTRFHTVVALGMASVFSAWLAADDLFMLHESVLPLAGLSQPMIYGLYGAIALGYLALSWRTVVVAAPVLLVMALSMLGASVSVDIFADHNLGAVSGWLHANPRVEVFLDDGFKFLGIGFWSCLHLVVAMSVLVDAVNAAVLKRVALRGFRTDEEV